MSKKRNATVELLRIVSMLMIITLHAAGKSNMLGNYFGSGKAVYIVSWVLEAFAIFGLNMYILIAGYFMVDGNFKTGRFLSIILTILFYSTVILLLGFIGIIPMENMGTYEYLQCLLPLHMETYWYCTAYVIAYLLMPVLARGVKAMSKKALGATIILLLIFESLFKSVLPVRLEADDKGYSALWFITLFLVAAYIRLYGIRFFNNVKRGIITYVVCAVLIALEEFALQFVYVKFGRLELLDAVSIEYNHIFLVIGSIGLFTAFINAKPIEGAVTKAIMFFSTGAFGVYLIHEHILLRYQWQKWFGIDKLADKSVLLYLPTVLIAVIAVFVIGVLIDKVRAALFACVGKALKNSRIAAKMAVLDNIINGG